MFNVSYSVVNVSVQFILKLPIRIKRFELSLQVFHTYRKILNVNKIIYIFTYRIIKVNYLYDFS